MNRTDRILQSVLAFTGKCMTWSPNANNMFVKVWMCLEPITIYTFSAKRHRHGFGRYEKKILRVITDSWFGRNNKLRSQRLLNKIVRPKV